MGEVLDPYCLYIRLCCQHTGSQWIPWRFIVGSLLRCFSYCFHQGWTAGPKETCLAKASAWVLVEVVPVISLTQTAQGDRQKKKYHTNLFPWLTSLKVRQQTTTPKKKYIYNIYIYIHKESIPPTLRFPEQPAQCHPIHSTPPKKKTKKPWFRMAGLQPAPFPPKRFSTRHACPVLVLSRHAFGTRFPWLGGLWGGYHHRENVGPTLERVEFKRSLFPKYAPILAINIYIYITHM